MLVTELSQKTRTVQQLGTSFRIPALDGVRGLAIILVLCWHYVRMQLFDVSNPALTFVGDLCGICWSGVDLFFVLSGFLLGGILIDNRQSSNYYKTFYIRRICRIFPLYYAWILLVVILGAFLASGRLAPLFRDYSSIWPVLTYTQNITQIVLPRGAISPLFAVTWSLAVEEQFYLLLPWLIRIINPKQLPFWLVLLVLSSTVFRLAMWYFGPRQGWAGYVLLPCRWDSLFLGVLGAWLVRRPGVPRGVRDNQWFIYALMGIIGVAIVILRVVKQGNLIYLGMHELGFLWLAVFYLALILLVLTTDNRWIKGFFQMRWLCWLGTISYGLYIFHEPILTSLQILLGRGTPHLDNLADVGVTLLALAVSLLLASLSWHFFESRLVAWGRRHSY
jgi:peptidoglycan/LPS O-acetylase OafA/YrhL